MEHASARRVLPAFLLLALIAAGIYYLSTVSAAEDGPIESSGTVEGVEVSVAPEIPGRVLEVMVVEGQLVQAGDPLFRMDDASLQVRRRRVKAAGDAAIAAAHLQLLKAQQDLDTLLEDAPMIAAQAQLDLANARDALDDADRRRTYQQKGHRATSETIEGTEAQLVLAEEAVDQATKAYNKLRGRAETDPARAAARAALEDARDKRDAVEATLNWYRGEPSDIDQAVLDANFALAQAQLAQAQLDWEKWKDGPDPAKLALAQETIANAEAQLEAAQAQSAADLEAVDLEMAKLVVLAPISGVVITRSVEPGEVINAGATAIAIGDLGDLKITVYVPEDRYGQIDLGDQSAVTVDAYLGEMFLATVTRIADRAEFTPRNVQTEEGRRSTVYAVELAVSDPGGKLKLGMPANVRFEG